MEIQTIAFVQEMELSVRSFVLVIRLVSRDSQDVSVPFVLIRVVLVSQQEENVILTFVLVIQWNIILS